MRFCPLLSLAGALALGEAVALAFPGSVGLWPLTLALTVLVLLFGYGFGWPGWGLLATALLGFAVAGSHVAERQHLLDGVFLERGPFACEVTLRETPRVRGGWCAADVTAAGLDLHIVFPAGAAEPKAGDVWRFAGWLERRPATDFSRRKLWVKGAGTSAYCVRPAGPHAPRLLAERLRRNLSRRLGLGLAHAPETADLNRAILLGERRGIDRVTREAFAAAGTTHVFAISGLHVMCIAGILFAACVACAFPVRMAAFAVVPPLWGYVLLVGAAPSAVRAAAMATLYLFAPVVWRQKDGLAAWSVVFLVVHLLNPLQLVQVGSCLSFAVMLTLILFDRWYREVVPSRRGEFLVLPLAVWAAGVPIVAAVFERFTPGAVLANLLILPIVCVSVFASALGVMASFLSVTLAAYFNNAAALATSVMVGVSRVTAALPCASWEVAAWPLAACCAWYLVLILSLFLIRSIVLRRREMI